MKSKKTISTIGRLPARAAPIPMPVSASSAIGVSRNTLVSKFSPQPARLLKIAPARPNALSNIKNVWIPCHFFSQGLNSSLRVTDHSLGGSYLILLCFDSRLSSCHRLSPFLRPSTSPLLAKNFVQGCVWPRLGGIESKLHCVFH